MSTANRIRVGWISLAAVLLAPLACGDANDSSGVAEVVEIHTEAGVTPGMMAVLDLFRTSHPKSQLVFDWGASAQQRFEQRMNAGQPPDVFEAFVGYDLLRWATGGTTPSAQSLVEPLDSLALDQAYAGVFPAGLLEAVSADGHLYGVPAGIERQNTLFYSKQIFDANGLAAPVTLDDFFVVAENLKAKGIIPLAISGTEAWPIGSIAWPGLLIEEAGAPYFVEFFRGNKSPADPEIRRMLTKLSSVLDYTNYRIRTPDVAALLAANPTAPDPEDPASLSPAQAVDLVFDGKAAMTIMGDGPRAYLADKGWQPDVAFGEVPMFGTGATFVFSGSAFALPVGASNRTGGLDLLKTFGSAEAQTAFNVSNGSTPGRIDADRAQFGSMDQKRMDDLASATAVVPVSYAFCPLERVDAFERPLRAFATDRNIDGAIQALGANYASLKLP